MAIIGVATVLSVSTIGIAVIEHDEDNKDMRAQSGDIEKIHAKAETTGRAPSSKEVAGAAQSD
jgi:hypothetical protein